MARMARITVKGEGWPGAPSYNTYYATVNDPPVPSEQLDDMWVQVRAAWEQLKTLCPNYVTHTVSRDIELLDPANGVLQQVYVHTGGDELVEGVGTGLSLPPSSALCLQHATGTFLDGRKVRGRSFISPISQGSSDADGTPTAAAIAIVAAVQTILVADPVEGEVFCVWSRPREASEDPVVEARVGSTAPIITITVPNQFATLRSRRD